jgi:hypothetical protein
MTTDQRFLEKVRDLIRMSDNAREEAESYADRIEDTKLKAEAQRLLDI